MNNKLVLVAAIFVIILAACGPAATPAPAALVPLNVCYSAPTATQAVTWYAFEKGVFEKYGLQVNLIQVSSGAKAIPALLSGDVSICQMTGNSVINAVAAGKDAVMIAGLFNTFPAVLVSQPGITTVNGLKGKIVGMSNAGSATEGATRLLMKNLGFVDGQDITLLEVGEEPARVAALDAGQIDAALFSPPYLHMMLEKGYTPLYFFNDLGIPYSHTGIVTTRQFLSENRAVVESFLKAILESIRLMKSDSEGTKEVLAIYTQTDVVANATDLTDAYENTILPYLQDLPYPSPEGLQTLIDIAVLTNPDAAKVTPAQLIDDSILKDLENSGFIASLEK